MIGAWMPPPLVVAPGDWTSLAILLGTVAVLGGIVLLLVRATRGDPS